MIGPRVRAGIAALRGRARVALAARGLGTVLVVVVALGLTSFGLDRILRLSFETRAVLLALALGLLAAVVARRLVRPLRAPLPDAELARAVEGHHPRLEWRLLSAVQFGDPSWRPGPETSRGLAAQTIDDADALAAEVDFAAPVPFGPPARALLRGGVVLLAGVLLATTFPKAFRTWVQRDLLLSTTARWPQDTLLKRIVLSAAERRLVIERQENKPLDPASLTLKVPHGAALVVEATVAGVVPKRVWADTRSAGGEAGPNEVLALDALGQGRFRATFDDLGGSFELQLQGGDDEVEPITVLVIRRPWIEALSFRVTPPPHTGLPARSFGVEAGAAHLPLGTKVELEARSSKPLVAGKLVQRAVGADTAAIVTGALATDGKSFRADWTLAQTAAFELEVEDQDGLGLAPPVRFSLVAEPDRPPDVQVRLIGVGLNVTPQATLRTVVSAQDDHLVARGRLALKITGAEKPEREHGQDVAALSSQKEAEAPARVELARLELVPKQALTLWAEAEDGDPRGPNKGASPAQALRVVTPEQLLAELLRRLHEQRLELERMIAEEEKLAQGLTGVDPKTLERAARAHRDVARAVVRAAEVVDGAVEEMITNVILDSSTHDRLRTEVVKPLRECEARALRTARDQAERAQDAPEAERPARSKEAGASAAVVVLELRAIVSKMGRIEEMAELIAALKRIIEEQRGVLDRTRKTKNGPQQPR